MYAWPILLTTVIYERIPLLQGNKIKITLNKQFTSCNKILEI